MSRTYALYSKANADVYVTRAKTAIASRVSTEAHRKVLANTDLILNGGVNWPVGVSPPFQRFGLDPSSERLSTDKIDLSVYEFPFDNVDVYAFKDSDEKVYDIDRVESGRGDICWKFVGRLERGENSTFFYVRAYHTYSGFKTCGGTEIYASKTLDGALEHYNAQDHWFDD